MKGSTIQDVFLENIKLEKETGITFIEEGDKTTYLSYKKLYLEASYRLYALQEKGIKSGDEVIFQFESNKSFIVTFWACVFGNFIPVPLTLGTTSDIMNKINGVLEKLKNPYIITDAPYLKTIIENYNLEHEGILDKLLLKFIYNDELRYSKKATPAPSNPSDLVFIQFSSGSTGAPKGVMNRHDSILYNIDIMQEKCKIQELDKFLAWVPLTHDMGLIFFHMLPLLTNVDQFLMPPMLFLGKPELWLENLSKHQITVSGSPNFGYINTLENIKNLDLEKLSFNTLRVMINSAEPVSIKACKEFAKVLEPYGFKKECISPGYGLAEAVLGVSLYYDEGDDLKEYFLNRDKLSIGNKVEFLESNLGNTSSFADLGSFVRTEIKITNENGESLSEDTFGIVNLRSPAITSGYYNDPVATKNLVSSDGWLNTGDIGFIHDNRLIITGRKKEMMIISGQNYFPNDIDNIIEELPEIRFQQAISCSIFNEEKYQDELFVFVQYIGKVEDFIALADTIKKRISIQTGITVKKVIAVEKIPRTTSGKIQRYVLKNRYLDGEYDKLINEFNTVNNSVKNNEYVPATTDLEKKLVEIWEDCLGIEGVGIADNFFYLGGNSLCLGSLGSKIQKVFKIHIDVRELFIRVDFKDQVELIKNAMGKPINEIKIIPKKPHYPISSMQKRLFIDYQINPLSIAYNTPVVLSFRDKININRCEAIFKKIIDRHEILRTSFHILNKEFIQKIHDTNDFHIQYVQTKDKNLNELLKIHIKPFNLENPTLFRAFFFEEENKLVLDIHHIVSDGASFDIILQEFNMLYRNEELSPMTFQYKDFTKWHEDLYLKESLDEQKEFWLHQFEDMPASLNLPYDFSRDNIKDSYSDTVTVIISEEKGEQLKEISKREGVTMFTLMLSTVYVLFYKITYQEDIVIGTSTIGRWHKDLDGLIGMFTNLLALRNFPKGEASFSSFLKAANTNVIECLVNQKYTYEKLVNDLKITPSKGKTPLFNIMFEYYAFNWSKDQSKDSLHAEFEFPVISSKFDLSIKTIEEENRLVFLFDYNTDLFRRDSVERFSSYFIRILEQVIENRELLLKDIEILSNTEKNKILTEFNKVS